MKASLLCILLIISAYLPTQAQLTVSGFTNYNLHGFNVLVNNQAISGHATAVQGAVDYLDTLLLRVTQYGLEAEVLDSLKAIPIFMEWALTTGSAWYHYDVNWLIQNGYNPAKARAVEITNITNFVNWSRQNQPMVIMHELAHGYNDHVLTLGYPAIGAAFTHAVNTGIYNSVPYNPGNGNPQFNLPAYALSNQQEYFAEITEAYLGQNDYYPFDSTDLRSFDPMGYEVVKAVWRFGGNTAIGDEAPWQVRMYPVPAEDLLFVESSSPQPLKVYLSDTMGRVYDSFEVGKEGLQIDLSGYASGLYMLIFQDDRYRSSRRFVKK
ncbi:MAG: T9SS C-terminal target domain-containing protein [Bacteroidetes bacterium]|nr:MAG: T9SS C-terminal target domain-containing protein [Bacteroidota bacterium]